MIQGGRLRRKRWGIKRQVQKKLILYNWRRFNFQTKWPNFDWMSFRIIVITRIIIESNTKWKRRIFDLAFNHLQRNTYYFNEWQFLLLLIWYLHNLKGFKLDLIDLLTIYLICISQYKLIKSLFQIEVYISNILTIRVWKIPLTLFSQII